MSSNLDATLMPHENKCVASHFEVVDVETIRRATELVRKGAVKQTRWSEGRQHLHGIVQAGRLFEVQIQFEDDGTLSTECTCPMRYDCPHVIAVLLVTAEGKKGGAVQSSAARAATATPEPLAELEREVTERVKKPLPQKASNALRVIQKWWDRKLTHVTEGDFRSTMGGADLWARNQKALFPKTRPPKSAWELLHCIDLAAARLSLALPSPIESALDPALSEALAKIWEEERALKKWRLTMEKWAENTRARTAPEAPKFRLRIVDSGALVEWKPPGAPDFTLIKITPLREWCGAITGSRSFDHAQVAALTASDRIVLQVANGNYSARADVPMHEPSLREGLSRLLRSSDMRSGVSAKDGTELPLHDDPLRWELREIAAERPAYELSLLKPDGSIAPPAVAIVRGKPLLYVTPVGAWQVSGWPFDDAAMQWPQIVPVPVLESDHGAAVLQHLGIAMPDRLAARVVIVKPRVTVSCRLHTLGSVDYLRMDASADYGLAAPEEKWDGNLWLAAQRSAVPDAGDKIVRFARDVLPTTGAWINGIGVKLASHAGVLEKRITKDFPEEFLAWIARRPDGIEVQLDPDLASLRDGRVSAMVKLDVEESGIDWFDLKVSLDVNDTTLLPGELDLLLKAKGKWVRLGGRGWRKLEFQLSDEDQKQLADMGLAVSEFDGQPQRLHALQLAGAATKSSTLLPAERAAAVRVRAEEIQTRVSPGVPSTITATLRPYQQAGFHFLAYLTANHFGGVLADDMGLGKTLQTLAWLAWLRDARDDKATRLPPSLVVCPKSVQDNWMAESRRFFPTLRVGMWSRQNAGGAVPDDCELLIVHYQHLRLYEERLAEREWHVVILDEAQAIKNPSSQTAIIACRLRAQHRLALTGTPIENRLLDLWSIMSFAMPGVLGGRAQFTKNFDAKGDPFARVRLAARVRPFLLRRTKKEVASDLPDRIEEDLVCDLEGVQQKLYTAELKRARAALLKLKTAKELDKARFNILTSLLRLRQICCHPQLVGCDEKNAGSAKLEALAELLDPLMQEGHKVIIFSQFVDMIELISGELRRNEWPHFILTGSTDDRGSLVAEFQNTEGPAVFLISLKAGGFGLNLTAASYVVLFDPWWNPAVEAQAIDRTHRIGQTRTVIAYRLIMKETIEEKIRLLQKQKGALAQDILGEENFAKALTLDDFRFLLGGED